MKVMLVDEEGAVRLRIRDALLETDGIDLTMCPPDCAPGHDEVFQRVVNLQPDVVVIDVSMPSGGALDLIGRIKGLSDPPVVIALSSTSSLTYRALCHRAGAEFYLDLTHDQEGLVHAMAELKNELRC